MNIFVGGFRVIFYIILLIVIFIGIAVFYNKFYESSDFMFKEKISIEIPKDRIKKVVLDNGMTILALKDESVPKVLVQIAYNVGSAIENPDERGLAHLIEHMIFKGTDKLSESDIDAIARKYGAGINAFTSKDVTSYYFEVDSGNWKNFLPILADCMTNARFDSQHLASEVKAVIEELRMIKDNYWRLMIEKADELTFPSNHPYHNPIIGYKTDLLGFTSERLKKFYNKYYRPNRATLFIVGNIDLDEATTSASEIFDVIKAEKSEETPAFPYILPEPVTSQTKIYKQIDKPMLGFYWRIPGFKDKELEKQTAVEFVLGAGEGSRLYQVLVEDEKVANSVEVGSNTCMEAGNFFILIEPKDGQESRCKELVEQELHKLIVDGATSNELEKMVKNKTRDFFVSSQSYGSFVYDWIMSYFSTGNEYDIFEEVRRLSTLKSQDLQSFTKEYLDPFLMGEIQVLPLPKEREAAILKASELEDKLDGEILAKHVRTAPVEAPKYIETMARPNALEFEYPKPARTFTLDNGLKVNLFAKNDKPILDFNLAFRDSTYFSSSKEGRIIGMMMDMLMEGSEGYSKKDHVKFFEDEGVAYGFGESGVHLTMVNQGVVKALQRMMLILKKPTFPKDDFEKIRSIIIDGYIRAKNDPMAVASRSLKGIAYQNKSFGWTFDEAITELEKLELSSLPKIHKSNVSPSHMILSVVGDMDVDQMEKDIKKVFEDWQGVDYVPPVLAEMGNSEKTQQVDHFMLRNQVVLLLGKRSELDIYHEDLIPLRLLNYACWYSLGSRLFQLRERTGLFYTAGGSWTSGASWFPGVDLIYAILSMENVDSAEKSLKELVDNIAQNGITQKELDVSRQLYLKTLIDSTSTNAGLAGKFSALDSLNLGFDYYDKVLNRVNTLSLEAINDIAKKYYKSGELNRIRVGRFK